MNHGIRIELPAQGFGKDDQQIFGRSYRVSIRKLPCLLFRRMLGRRNHRQSWLEVVGEGVLCRVSRSRRLRGSREDTELGVRSWARVRGVEEWESRVWAGRC